MKYSVSYSCICHVGKCRRMNQDNFICEGRYRTLENEGAVSLTGSLCSQTPAVLGVFDGMGGEECGETAALIAAQDAAELILTGDMEADLLGLCQKANEDICRYIREHNLSSMGTTAALLGFTQNGITLCNIGDSKIFRFSDGILRQISVDHVSAAPFGGKAPLYQSLGIPPEEMLIEPYIGKSAYKPGDLYLICSDGLTDMMTNGDIEELLCRNAPEKAAQLLLEGALSNGGVDNITLILCGIQREGGGWLSRLWPF